MQTKIYVVRDAKLAMYHTPFFCRSGVDAARSIQQAMINKEIKIAHFAEDFELIELGTFDDITGKMVPLKDPKFMINLNVLKMEEARRQLNNDATFTKRVENGNKEAV